MLYASYEMSYAALKPFQAMATAAAEYFGSSADPLAETWLSKANYASAKVIESATRRYGKPDWKLPSTTINDVDVPIAVNTVLEKPFGSLVHFKRDEDALRAARGDAPDPRVLIVAPMSGHYATLLRGTVQAMLPDHEVFVTDWADARTVPLFFGQFDLNDYIDYLIEFIGHIGPQCHTIAVCQPGPALLAATAVMSEAKNPAAPRSMTFMGSPIDARKSPTVTNLLAEQKAFEWFESNMVQTVPAPHGGVARRVYPGFLQLFNFMSMNIDRHSSAMWDYFEHMRDGKHEAADKHERFYDEYLSVCDMTAEFYLQTVHEVFQKYSLARGTFTHHGQLVDLSAIKKTALLTVEGELDDISGIGQTQAAHDLCTNIPARDQEDYVQKGAGHYGVFSGSKWRNHIQPKVAKFIRDRFDEDAERKFQTKKS